MSDPVHLRERLKLLDALGVDLKRTDPSDAAAISALCDEVIALRADVTELRAKLDDTALMADSDALTPVFNRRAFQRELTREISVAERYGSPLCLIFIDLDRFKQVNDSFGHQTGDDVLKTIADMLIVHTRDTDIVGRLGGDEFGIALTHAAYEDSARKASELTTRIDRLIVRDAADDTLPSVRLGASCGVAEWQKGMSCAQLIAEADEAMFALKASRRTRSA